jgi:hypothetical protein
MNDAYVVFAEWGPKRRIPRGERLERRFPRADAETRRGWVEAFEAVERSIWDCAEQWRERAWTEASFVAQMRSLHPWMREKALGQAWFLARYYAWHEGYDR